jgi:hypothetical protein
MIRMGGYGHRWSESGGGRWWLLGACEWPGFVGTCYCLNSVLDCARWTLHRGNCSGHFCMDTPGAIICVYSVFLMLHFRTLQCHHHLLHAVCLQIYTWNKQCLYVHSAAAVVWLQFMVHIMLFSINIMHVYVSNFLSMCAWPRMAVCCSSLLSCFPGMFIIISYYYYYYY